MDDALLSEVLEARADRRLAVSLRRDIQPLKGVRGTPSAEVAKLCADTWRRDRPDADRDRAALDRLFAAAWEDGLLAIGLAAASLPDDPHAVWDLAVAWLDRVDDILTADALGWLLLGPAALASGGGASVVTAQLARHAHPAPRRAVVSACLAWMPVPLEGPSVAALRARLGVDDVAFVEAPHSAPIAEVLSAVVKDEHPSVRKGIRRVLRSWSRLDPAATAAWAASVKGGLPRLFKPEVDRARRAAARQDALDDGTDAAHDHDGDPS